MKLNRIAALSMLIVFVFTASVFADVIETLVSPVAMSKDSIPMREINIKVGFDFDGKYDLSEDIAGLETRNLDTGNNVSFAAEYIQYIYDYIGIGGGFSAQIPRWIDELPGKFGFAPAYLSVKVRSWPQEPGLYAYISGQVGYNLFYGDSSFRDKMSVREGGFYYGVGIGVVYKAFLAEGLFSSNSGIMEDENNDKISVDYGKITVSVGCRL